VQLPQKIAETQAWKDAGSLQPTVFLPNGTVAMDVSLQFSIAWLHSHDLIISEAGTIPGLDVVVSEDNNKIEDGPQFDQSVLVHNLHRHLINTGRFTTNQQCRIMYEFVGLSITADQWRQPGMTRSPALRDMPHEKHLRGMLSCLSFTHNTGMISFPNQSSLLQRTMGDSIPSPEVMLELSPQQHYRHLLHGFWVNVRRVAAIELGDLRGTFPDSHPAVLAEGESFAPATVGSAAAVGRASSADAQQQMLTNIRNKVTVVAVLVAQTLLRMMARRVASNMLRSLAENAYSKNDYLGALKLYQNAKVCDPANYKTWSNLALCFAKLNAPLSSMDHARISLSKCYGSGNIKAMYFLHNVAFEFGKSNSLSEEEEDSAEELHQLIEELCSNDQHKKKYKSMIKALRKLKRKINRRQPPISQFDAMDAWDYYNEKCTSDDVPNIIRYNELSALLQHISISVQDLEEEESGESGEEEGEGEEEKEEKDEKEEKEEKEEEEEEEEEEEKEEKEEEEEEVAYLLQLQAVQTGDGCNLLRLAYSLDRVNSSVVYQTFAAITCTVFEKGGENYLGQHGDAAYAKAQGILKDGKGTYANQQLRLDAGFYLLSLAVHLKVTQYNATVDSYALTEATKAAEELIDMCILGRDELRKSHGWKMVSAQEWFTPVLHKIPALMGKLMGIFNSEQVARTEVDDQGETVTVFRQANSMVR